MEELDDLLSKYNLDHLLYDIHANGLTREMINSSPLLRTIMDENIEAVNHALEIEEERELDKLEEKLYRENETVYVVFLDLSDEENNSEKTNAKSQNDQNNPLTQV